MPVDLKSKELNGINEKIIIIKPNVLTGGKTYALKLKVCHKSKTLKFYIIYNSNFYNIFKDKFGKLENTTATYYFSVNRGPSYGECSVVDEKEGNNLFRFHCAQWQNRQNDNEHSISQVS